MSRITRIKHSLAAVLIVVVVSAVAAAEPLNALAGQGSPGGF